MPYREYSPGDPDAQKEKISKPSLAELMAKGDFYRSDLDEYLKNNPLTTEDAMTLAGDRHWSELLFNAELPDQSLPEEAVGLMCANNGASPKLFNFLRTKVRGINNSEELFNSVLKSPEGRYNLLQDLNRVDTSFEFTPDMLKKLLSGFGKARTAELSSSICWYVVDAVEQGRLTGVVFDESFLNTLLDYGVIMNIWLAAKFTEMTWNSFERVLKAVTDESHGRDRDLAEWTLIRALGERQWVNDNKWIEPVAIADNRVYHLPPQEDDGGQKQDSWLDLAMKHRVLPLLLKNNRLEKISGFEKRHVEALVEQTINSLSYNEAQEKIDNLIVQCRNLPGFSLTPEYVKKFLDLNWNPGDTYSVDEVYLGTLLDKDIPIDFSVLNRVHEMSWAMFVRILEQSTEQGKGEINTQLFERLFGEKMAGNGGPALNSLTVTDTARGSELLDAMMRADVLMLIVKRNWFDKISGMEPRHLKALIKKICSGSSKEDACGYIEKLMGHRAAISGFKITTELLKEFLLVGWKPTKIGEVDCLVEEYGSDLVKKSEDVFKFLFEKGQISHFSKVDLEKITNAWGSEKKLWVLEKSEDGREPKRRWRVPITELEVLSEAGYVDVADISSEAAAKKYAETLLAQAAQPRFKERLGASWGDQATGAHIQNFAAVFKYERLFSFAESSDNRHDVFQNTADIIELYRQTGLSDKQFYGNILQQVARDGGVYNEGSAYDYFNALARNLTTDSTLEEKLHKLHDIAATRTAIPEMKECLEVYKTVKDTCSSWQKFKRFYELLDLAGDPEFFDELTADTTKGGRKKYDFAVSLLYHKFSKVNAAAVKSLFRTPRQFLDAGDDNAIKEIHNEKKPSNFLAITNLDLTAEQLRDAYIGGDLDRLQAFPPLTIEYHLDGKKFGLSDETIRVVTKLNVKSDPNAAIAGDDTACCMPFGSGKNTVYTFNLGTALFTVQLERKDTAPRTIAQSVMTKDIKVGRPVDDIMRDLKIPKTINETPEQKKEREARPDKPLHEVIPVEAVAQAASYAACDNVEVNKNYKEKYQQLIKAVYADFFKEYLDRFGKQEGFVADKVPVGKANSDALTNLDKETNEYVPRAPISYSDKIDNEVLVLVPKVLAEGVLKRTVRVPVVEKAQKQEEIGIKGVEYLTYQDSLAVGYLESKAYSDNKSLVAHLSQLENTLMAQDINNLIKNRPNMSTKYVDAQGRIRGALIAYEGFRPGDKTRKGESIVYLNNLTSDLVSNRAGGSLILSFIKLYKKNYLDTGSLLPIHTLARDKTSYPILLNNLKSISADLGINFELTEEKPIFVGNDMMHPVTIRPIKKINP